MSSGFPPGNPLQTVQRQHSSSSAGPTYARRSGYGNGYPPHQNYSSPGHRNAQDPWMQYRDSSQRSVSSRTSSSGSRSYTDTYGAPASSYTLQSRRGSASSRYSGYGYSGSESSTSYAPRSVYDSEDDDYTHAPAPSSVVEAEPYHASSGYAEMTFVVEPSDSGSEASYSGDHSPYDDSESERGDSGSSYSGSEGDSVYSEGADDSEYDDYDDGGSYSEDDGGYYSDD
ncbi:hypothetical protein B0H11DRAFT_2232589 [Mycena galericulata]|nr:hypothetical protein B0H11DRAFT_2232589 [Mycena galericulata]